jgi:hypothetical protein
VRPQPTPRFFASPTCVPQVLFAGANFTANWRLFHQTIVV